MRDSVSQWVRWVLEDIFKIVADGIRTQDVVYSIEQLMLRD